MHAAHAMTRRPNRRTAPTGPKAESEPDRALRAPAAPAHHDTVCTRPLHNIHKDTIDNMHGIQKALLLSCTAAAVSDSDCAYKLHKTRLLVCVSERGTLAFPSS